MVKRTHCHTCPHPYTLCQRWRGCCCSGRPWSAIDVSNSFPPTHMQLMHTYTHPHTYNIILLHEWEGSTVGPIQKPRTEYSPVLPDLRSAIIYLLYDLALASSINGLDSSSVWKRWHQSYVKPFHGGRLQFHWIIKLWSALLLFSFSHIHWLQLRKNGWQQPVPSLVTTTPPNQQCPFQSREMLNRYGEKLNWYGKIFGSGTQNVSNQIVTFWGYLFRV